MQRRNPYNAPIWRRYFLNKRDEPTIEQRLVKSNNVKEETRRRLEVTRRRNAQRDQDDTNDDFRSILNRLKLVPKETKEQKDTRAAFNRDRQVRQRIKQQKRLLDQQRVDAEESRQRELRRLHQAQLDRQQRTDRVRRDQEQRDRRQRDQEQRDQEQRNQEQRNQEQRDQQRLDRNQRDRKRRDGLRREQERLDRNQLLDRQARERKISGDRERALELAAVQHQQLLDKQKVVERERLYDEAKRRTTQNELVRKRVAERKREVDGKSPLRQKPTFFSNEEVHPGVSIPRRDGNVPSIRQHIPSIRQIAFEQPTPGTKRRSSSSSSQVQFDLSQLVNIDNRSFDFEVEPTNFSDSEDDEVGNVYTGFRFESVDLDKPYRGNGVGDGGTIDPNLIKPFEFENVYEQPVDRKVVRPSTVEEVYVPKPPRHPRQFVRVPDEDDDDNDDDDDEGEDSKNSSDVAMSQTELKQFRENQFQRELEAHVERNLSTPYRVYRATPTALKASIGLLATAALLQQAAFQFTEDAPIEPESVVSPQNLAAGSLGAVLALLTQNTAVLGSVSSLGIVNPATFAGGLGIIASGAPLVASGAAVAATGAAVALTGFAGQQVSNAVAGTEFGKVMTKTMFGGETAPRRVGLEYTVGSDGLSVLKDYSPAQVSALMDGALLELFRVRTNKRLEEEQKAREADSDQDDDSRGLVLSGSNAVAGVRVDHTTNEQREQIKEFSKLLAEELTYRDNPKLARVIDNEADFINESIDRARAKMFQRNPYVDAFVYGIYEMIVPDPEGTAFGGLFEWLFGTEDEHNIVKRWMGYEKKPPKKHTKRFQPPAHLAHTRPDFTEIPQLGEDALYLGDREDIIEAEDFDPGYDDENDAIVDMEQDILDAINNQQSFGFSHSILQPHANIVAKGKRRVSVPSVEDTSMATDIEDIHAKEMDQLVLIGKLEKRLDVDGKDYQTIEDDPDEMDLKDRLNQAKDRWNQRKEYIDDLTERVASIADEYDDMPALVAFSAPTFTDVANTIGGVVDQATRITSNTVKGKVNELSGYLTDVRLGKFRFSKYGVFGPVAEALNKSHRKYLTRKQASYLYWKYGRGGPEEQEKNMLLFRHEYGSFVKSNKRGMFGEFVHRSAHALGMNDGGPGNSFDLSMLYWVGLGAKKVGNVAIDVVKQQLFNSDQATGRTFTVFDEIYQDSGNHDDFGDFYGEDKSKQDFLGGGNVGSVLLA